MSTATKENDAELATLRELIGPEAFQKLISHFAGSGIYFPKRAIKARRNDDIRRLYFSGEQITIIARRYHLTERMIFRIVKVK